MKWKSIKNILTLKFLDQIIEDNYIKSTHKKRDKYINSMINKFLQDYPDADINHEQELREELKQEADRLYGIADRAILRANIKRSKWIFLSFILLFSIFFAIMMGVTHGGAITLLVPFLTAFFTWIVSASTISILVNERVKGGLDTILSSYEGKYEKELKKNRKKNIFDDFNDEELLKSLDNDSTRRLLKLLLKKLDSIEANNMTDQAEKNMELSVSGQSWDDFKETVIVEKIPVFR